VKLADREGMQRHLEALRRLYNSVIILDRAAEADIVSTTSNEDLVEEVDELRRDTCTILMILAAGETGAEQRTRQIDGTLKRLEDALSEDNPSAQLYLRTAVQNSSTVAAG